MGHLFMVFKHSTNETAEKLQDQQCLLIVLFCVVAIKIVQALMLFGKAILYTYFYEIDKPYEINRRALPGHLQ